LKISYRSGNEIQQAMISPVKSSEDDKYHIGLWVRDSTAGIGTLTFYDEKTGRFGALGHGITDIDTGTLMSVKSGEILESSILGVKRADRECPASLRAFSTEGTKLGTILDQYRNRHIWKADKLASAR
jgi:stage IV sporulation protein B